MIDSSCQAYYNVLSYGGEAMSIAGVLVRGRDGGNRQGGLQYGQRQKGMIESIFTKAPFKDTK
jgi:hypothetical protein